MTTTPVCASNITWFEHLSPAPRPLLRLFCFPYAGGSSQVYRSWQMWFPAHVDLCLVHLPGRGKRIGERAFTQLIPLAATICDHISEEIDVPYALYGHSMGALIGFELARELCRRHGAGPRHLFVSGHSAPQWPKDKPPSFDLPNDGFMAELKRFNGTPREVLENQELMDLLIDVLRADFQAAETYQYLPGERLSCPISVYGGLEDEHVPVGSCQAWQEQTSARCRVSMFKGDHFFVRSSESELKRAFQKDVLRIVETLLLKEI